MKPWSEMSPRERDALVAEKVMGWGNVHTKLSNPYDENSWEDLVGNSPLKEGDDGTRYGMKLGKCCPICNHQDNVTTPIKIVYDREKTVPAYSQDIRAAWEVVEKLLKDGVRGYGTNISLETRGDGSWSCLFYTPENHIEEYAPTAPEAICLAALRALGIET